MRVNNSTNIAKNTYPEQAKNSPKNSRSEHYLDTIGNNCGNLTFGKPTKWLKLARKKYEQQPVLQALISVNSPLIGNYYATLFCGSVIQVSNSKELRYTCKQRFCRMCNNIRTAKMVQGYGSAIMEWQKIGFLTLTERAVPLSYLPLAWQKRTKIFRQIQDKLRKQGILINGIRSSEVTINRKKGTAHLHYHFLIDGMEIAELLRQEWINHAEVDCLPFYQVLKPADKNSLIEVFKYAVKFEGKKDKSAKLQETDIKALDSVYQALKGKRTIQPIGKLRKLNVSDEITGTDEIEQAELIADGIYRWHRYDWFNVEDGTPLANYFPDENLDVILKPIYEQSKATKGTA